MDDEFGWSASDNSFLKVVPLSSEIKMNEDGEIQFPQPIWGEVEIKYQYSRYNGFLDLNEKLRKQHNINELSLAISIDEECFGTSFGRWILYYFIGYDSVIANMMKRLTSDKGTVLTPNGDEINLSVLYDLDSFLDEEKIIIQIILLFIIIPFLMYYLNSVCSVYIRNINILVYTHDITLFWRLILPLQTLMAGQLIFLWTIFNGIIPALFITSYFLISRSLVERIRPSYFIQQKYYLLNYINLTMYIMYILQFPFGFTYVAGFKFLFIGLSISLYIIKQR